MTGPAETPSRYQLYPGAYARLINEAEVAVGGAERTIVLRGPAHTLIRFLEPFVKSSGASFDEAFAHIAEPPDGAEQGLRAVFDSLVTNRTLVARDDGPSNATAPLLFISRVELPPVLLDGLGARIADAITIDGTPPAGFDWPDGTTVVAVGLHDAELHALNRRAAKERRTWIFCTPSPDRWIVSPVLRSPDTACFACLRLRRLGSLQDVVPNAQLERQLVNAAPELASAAELRIDDALLLSGVILKKLLGEYTWDVAAFSVLTTRTGEISVLQMLRVPGCFVCSAS